MESGKFSEVLTKRLIDAQKKYLPLPSSTPRLLNALSKIECSLPDYKRPPDKPTVVEMHVIRPIAEALIAKQVLRHPDFEVNVLVITCIGEILRHMAPETPYNDEQFKEFFDLFVLTFMKLYSASDQRYEDLFLLLVRFDGNIFLSSSNFSVFYHPWIHELESRLSSFSINLPEFKLIYALKNLFHPPSSHEEFLEHLVQNEKVLSQVNQVRSRSMSFLIFHVYFALLRKKVVRHPNMDVNISVACCICDILRVNAGHVVYGLIRGYTKLKGFFKLTVMTFEKLSSTSGGCYSKMIKVLETLEDARLTRLMLHVDMQMEEVVIRLFKQFLTVAVSNTAAVVLKMEKIMTIIIEESKEDLVPKLVDLLVASARKENQIALPVCWKLGGKVLNNCAAKLKPYLPDMEAKETTSNKKLLITDTSQKKKLECVEDTITISSDDSIMPSKSELEMDEERKRNYNTPTKQVVPPLSTKVSSLQSGRVWVQDYEVNNNIAPVLEAILNKHGDIAGECVFKPASIRANFLEVVCEVVCRIQIDDFTTISSDMEEIKNQVLALEAAKINVSWLRAHLEAFEKGNKAKNNSILLVKTKENTTLVKSVAQTDLNEARRRFKKAKRCVKLLELVENKLSQNILESNAEMDSWLSKSSI